jgi:ADP-heptose:LPS heptosyltransferase
MRILVRRSHALGDVILTTPIVRAIWWQYDSTAEIFVQTAYPAVYKNSLYAEASVYGIEDADRIIDLDLAYERRPSMHIIEAYMQEAFGGGDPCGGTAELFFNPTPVFLPDRPYVAVHAARAGWRNRTLPATVWEDVCTMLQRAGLWPILVGTERDDLPGAHVTRFQVPDILAQARLIASCACFVGSDSALLHAAGCTEVPIVGIFTCARPEYRLPYRHGVLGWNCIAMQPTGLDCLGCLERQPAPATTESCERGDLLCVRAVSAEEIVEAVISLVRK